MLTDAPRLSHSSPASMAGASLYARLLSYFRPDRSLITALVVLIWIALGVGALQPVVIAVLTDAVLSGRPAANPYAQRLIALAPAGTTGRVVALAATWLALQVTNDVVTLLREMINNRLRYN